jgi:hypothetical protein
VLESHAPKRWLILAAFGAAVACQGRSCKNGGAAKRAKPPSADVLDSTPLNANLVVDQFGYLPEREKIAIAANPVRGFNASKPYVPAAALEVRRFRDGAVVFTGPAVPWQGGALDELSGDRGAWFDFSSVRQPGTYVVYDPQQRTRSYPFEVKSNVYRDLLKASLRMFYFNRANIEKKAPFACVAGKCWTLAQNYLGPGQDREALSVKARGDQSSARDLSGGWWDAGDVNKYVTFARTPVHQLLTAYWEKPAPFSDDFNVPESGNGIPDVLDEVRVELEWLKKMQSEPAGGVLLKVGALEPDSATPDRAKTKHYYYPGACSSATVTAAGMFAHAAWLFRGLPALASYAAELRERAVRAFADYSAQPRRDDCDDGSITGGDADRTLAEQSQDAVVAAIYLFGLTGDPSYDLVVERDFTLTRPFKDDQWSAYEPDQGDALLFYTTLPKANPKVVAAIVERKQSVAKSADIFGFHPELDLYRAYLRKNSYHWGSNMVRANVGNTNYDLLQFKLASEADAAAYATRVDGLLHFFHGVNPLNLVFLSNMSSYGAENSASEIFHSWYRDGDRRFDSAKASELGPAPGYVPGGPNLHYCEDPKAACSRSALKGEPAGKAYRDFNTGWAPTEEYDRSWELSEPGLYYQSGYVKLVSKFVE